MILMPQEWNTSLATNEIREMLTRLAAKANVVVIVPSKEASRDWSSCANQVLSGDEVVGGVERLRTEHVGLTVLINRYDGIDLPRDACRILVIAGLPEVKSFSDLLDSEVLSDSPINLRRQIERIEQGMGRGVRSNDDYCAVLLLGTKLTGRLRSPEGEALLTPATRAQLNLTRKMAAQLESASLDAIEGAIMQCIGRDASWIKVSKGALVNIEADSALRIDSAKVTLRQAFDFARNDQPQKAIAALDEAISQAEDDQLKAWLLAKKSAFQHRIDTAAAQKTLVVAHSLERNVLKPFQGMAYKKLSATADQQANVLISNHSARFVEATDMHLFVSALCSDLKFQPNTAPRFEAAVKDLAWFIGISSHRPEKEFNEGPDNLWAMPNGTFLVIECKNGVVSEGGISKDDAAQLGQSIAWFEGRYPSSPSIPMMIHPSRTLGQGASVLTGMRVMDADRLEKLKTNLRAFADQIADPDVGKNATRVAERLTQFEFGANAFVNAFMSEAK
ncbi:helicase C-terminal domain-containing protein [Yoonia sp. 2307UL14-13]|uniref:helicase C-terminal domain-containing protein n=1 Tax=Yoonia sp. 2307UL14-13 TaxID=3126506 RepID=UPI0030A82E21